MIEIAENVRAEGALELCGADCGQAFLRMLFRGVVDHDIESPEFFDSSRDRLEAELLASDIARDQQAPPPGFLNQALRLLARPRVR